MTILLFLQRRATALYSVSCLENPRPSCNVLENPRPSCDADIHRTLLSTEHLVSHFVGTVSSHWSNSLYIYIWWYFLTIKGVKLLVPDVTAKKSQATQSCPENWGRGRFVCDSHLIWWDPNKPPTLQSCLVSWNICQSTKANKRERADSQSHCSSHHAKAAQD